MIAFMNIILIYVVVATVYAEKSHHPSLENELTVEVVSRHLLRCEKMLNYTIVYFRTRVVRNL